jgi:predicted DNA-binding antitoxin AbrB/MazE fold protein
MARVDAIYQDGVFKPVSKVDFAENQRVSLTINVIATPEDWKTWGERADKHRQEILDRRGGVPLPDCTPEIAEDRMRDI